MQRKVALQAVVTEDMKQRDNIRSTMCNCTAVCDFRDSILSEVVTFPSEAAGFSLPTNVTMELNVRVLNDRRSGD